MSEPEAATTPPAEEPATAATPAVESKPEATTAPKPETNWEMAYKGLQTNYNRLHQQLERQVQTQIGTSQRVSADVDVLLKTQLGDDGYKQHLAARQADAERQQALAAARTASEYIPQSINVIAETMRASGVPEKEIESIFATAATATSVTDWSEVVKAGTAAAIARSKVQIEQSVEAKIRATSREEIAAEAEVMAEKTVRARGIDKVDTGRGQSRTPERSFTERLRSIDRNTPEGEAAFQVLNKEAKRGTLKT